MTIGERIQAFRRTKGMSQEALGEALGVSRQAISKWESDAAMPEIEKLVALSRLFGVPVGVLLGVEEPADGAERNAASEELTEREWQAVEAIVSRYLEEAEAKRPRPHRKRWLALGAAALLFAVMVLYNQFDRIDNSIRQLQSGTNHISTRMDQQLGSLTNRVEEILERQNSLVAQSGYEVLAYHEDNGRLLVRLYATPKEYTPGMTARFLIEGDDFETVTADGVQEDLSFSCQVELPPTNEARVTVAFDNGEQIKTQQMDTLHELASMVYVELFTFYTGSFGQYDGTWSLDGSVEFHYDCGELVTLRTAELCIYRDGVLEESRPFELTAEDPLDGTLPCEREIEVAEGERVDIAVRAVDIFGREHFSLAIGAVMQNGNLEYIDGFTWDSDSYNPAQAALH